MRSWDRASSLFIICSIFFRSRERVATSSSLSVVTNPVTEQIVAVLLHSIRTTVVFRHSRWSLRKFSSVGIFRPRVFPPTSPFEVFAWLSRLGRFVIRFYRPCPGSEMLTIVLQYIIRSRCC